MKFFNDTMKSFNTDSFDKSFSNFTCDYHKTLENSRDPSKIFASNIPIKPILAKRFDIVEGYNKFHQGLRNFDTTHTITQTKNPFNAVWSTQPKAMLDRASKLKDFNLLTRSGFNITIDNPKKNRKIIVPISPNMQLNMTLRDHLNK